MFVPTMVQDKLLDEDGYLSKPWQAFFEQLIQNMQQALSNEGFAVPPQSAGNMAIIQPNAMSGTLLFNSSAVNGGSPSAPNGQLYIRLADGTFHAIANL